MLKCSMNNGKDPLDSPQDVLRKLLVIYSFNIFFHYNTDEHIHATSI